MELIFTMKEKFGKRRYYPTTQRGIKLLSLLRRKSFTEAQVAILASCQEFNIKIVSEKESENV